MQAMKGFAGALRSRSRLLVGCLALALAIGGTLAQGASAERPHKEKENKKYSSYIALGDSLAFGYSEQLYNENEPGGDEASKFHAGYANYYFKRIDKAIVIEGKNHGKPVNFEDLGCPGETTASLIGNKLAGTILEGFPHPATTEAPCAYQEAWGALHEPGLGGPLHEPYYEESQLEDAMKRIFKDAEAEKPVKTISLDIGANDELHLVDECEHSEESTLSCLKKRVPALIGTITTNIADMVYLIRHGEEFEPGGWLDYTGRIILVATYDPYGVVFKEGEEEYPTGCAEKHETCAPQGREELPESNVLAGALTSFEASTFKEEIKEGGFCIANMQEAFNPSYNPADPGESTAPERKHEAHLLKSWTNMANRNVSNGKADGPDIHPTMKGYHTIARLMAKDCPEA